VPISEWSKHWPDKLERIEQMMQATGRVPQ